MVRQFNGKRDKMHYNTKPQLNPVKKNINHKTTEYTGFPYIVGLGEFPAVLGDHLQGSGEHLLAEHGLALLQVVVQVQLLSAQAAGLGSRVEVGHLGSASGGMVRKSVIGRGFKYT